MSIPKSHLIRHIACALLGALICFTSAIPTAAAEPFLNSTLISDNMVIQRDMEVPLWGWARPGEKITATLNNQTASAVTGDDGRWQLKIGPFEAGGPYSMRIRGENAGSSASISNVMVGEVWICSGQSNMEMTVAGKFGGAPTGVKNSREEVAGADYPQIRMFLAQKQLAGKPVKNLTGSWSVCSPDTASSFSAVGYFFGRDIHKELKVPVGLINVPWGGGPIQAFMSRELLEGNPEFKPIIESGDQSIEKYTAGLARYIADLEEWGQQAIKAEADGVPAPAKLPAMPTGRDPRNFHHTPTRIFNGMIAPAIPYGIRGVIWYQGESNAPDPDLYASMFPAMIGDWRARWQQGDFPFLYVQLANFAGANPNWAPDSWARIREVQLRALALPNTAMAVAADIGESKNIHPLNKQDVGHRLALGALAKTYGKDIPYSGPIYDSMRVEGNKVRLKFQHSDGGLMAKDASGNLSADALLQTFTIAGADQQFVPAQAKIEGDTVVAWSDDVRDPIAVRYGWSNDPVGCNLYNAAGLPASPFRSDDWE